jgi:hypothetical protein
MASNQSLDLDFARKVMDFKLAEVEAGAMNTQVPSRQFRIMPGTATGIAASLLTLKPDTGRPIATRSPRRRRRHHWRARVLAQQWRSSSMYLILRSLQSM